MDISLIIKVAGVGMLVSIAAQVLGKAGREEQAMLVSIAGLVVVMLLLVREVGNLFDTVKSVFGV
ncbi:MAG: stage III sporulation protein AC [Clostridia bacterium]|nr:stage III sporulation protein AC [Clostridia bacterium]